MSYPTPWQPWQGQGQGQGGPSMLASHADRERAVDVLRAGFGEGRLEQAEFEKRVARAYAARTVGELAVLVGDLPQGPVPMTAGPGAVVPQTFLPAPRPMTNGKAVGAMVCGLLTVVTLGATGIPAVVLGHSARSEMRRTGESGDGLAMTGLVLGWLSVAGWALFLMLAMIAAVAAGG
ncbi:DUF1707 and DUF4190 domain-containing protein [Streptomyces sp. NPDC048448]|uniref:DUF1707 and DUF4190 domain-containing protein n=1 Tax=unclassified Streptomyces TaxID=2593676 RepID=UPI002001E0B6|nr:DUF1707 and DUF4190 domain-containing protein [Streptomyces sp. RPA4-2]